MARTSALGYNMAAGCRGPRRHRVPRQGSGLVMIWFSLFLVVLLITSSMVVDLGAWYVRAQQLQRAADAAALAGVVYMPDDFASAQITAIKAAKKNGIDTTADADLSIQVTTS